jgi:UV DNA damage endonuclease
MAAEGLKSSDTRRWRQGPHLKCSLEHLDRIFDHLAAKRIDMYRMDSNLAPYVTHPDMPQFHGMIAESASDLAAAGRKARALGLRLSFHPSQYILLNSPDPGLTERSIADLAAQAEILDRMELGPEAVMVIHVGGVYDDRAASRARWVQTWPTLPEPARRRLVLENDDLRFSAADVLWIHGETGVRCIFDYQHHWCFNPEGMALEAALAAILVTWPAGARPKIHFSSPRTEMREVVRAAKPAAGGRTRRTTVLLPPIWTGHADYINPFEFARFMRDAEGLAFDVMLEAKGKDLALLKLRPDLLRYAPDVAARFGLTPAEADDLAAEEAALDAGAAVEAIAETD